MLYDVEIQFYFNHYVKHTSHILAGLVILDEQKKINLSWKRLNLEEVGHGSVMILVKENSTGKTLKLAFDMHDMSSVFNNQMLHECDYYYKRSYFSPDIKKLPVNLQHKVRVYGINLPMATKHYAWKLFLNGAIQISAGIIKSPSLVIKLLKSSFNSYHQFVGLPSPEQYMQSNKVAVPETIFFQTRLWEQEYVGNDLASDINNKRVEMIHSLRKEFGNRFVGGLLPTDYARANYRDLITDLPTDSKGYIKKMQSNLVGIYTRGLNHSIALKMPEYIAASLCIVSESIRNEVTGEFTEGVNYLGFEDIDLCVSHCDKLLSDRNLSEKMREANHNYYLSELEPSSKALKCLTEAFSL